MIKNSLFAFTLHFVRPHKWSFLAMVLFRMSFVLDNVAIPYAFSRFIQQLTNHAHNPSWGAIVPPLLLLCLVILTIDLLFRLFDYFKARTIPLFEAEIRSTVVSHLQAHGYPFFVDHLSGELGKRVEDLTIGVSDIIMTIISSFLPALSTMFLGLISFFVIGGPLFGAIVLLWLLFYLLVYFIFTRKCIQASNHHAQKLATLSGTIVDGFSNILSIKLFSKNSRAIDHLIAPQRLEQQAQRKFLISVMQLHFLVSSLAVIFMAIGMLVAMTLYWRIGLLSIPKLTYMFYTASNICKQVWDAVSYFPDFFQEVGFCKQALKTFHSRDILQDPPDAPHLHCPVAPAIQFREIHFSYAQSQPLFRGQSLSIAPGEKVGLVGLSGSGKTTLIKLLLRFFQPQEGAIFINGQDIAQVREDSLRQVVSFIPQDSSLFHSTILENIRYGKKEATDEEVMDCAKKMQCHEFISSFAQGYHSLVGERGAKLSGGQRQRISIARALLKNAPILILDEATSALDAITEKEIQESLSIAMAGKTVLVIAHRFSVLSTMDRILVFNQGDIVAEGRHHQLLKSSPLYASICKIHTSGLSSLGL